MVLLPQASCSTWLYMTNSCGGTKVLNMLNMLNMPNMPNMPNMLASISLVISRVCGTLDPSVDHLKEWHQLRRSI